MSALHRGGYLHDVGKIGIADAILQKPTPLNAAEYATMKAHTVIGDRLCGNLRSLALVRPIVRHHHELLNGAGYPDGLVGDQIPLLAQIVGVVDAYDAMTTSRPYRAALSVEAAHEELRRDVGPRLAPARPRRSVHRAAVEERHPHTGARSRRTACAHAEGAAGRTIRGVSAACRRDGRGTHPANLLTSRFSGIAHFSGVPPWTGEARRESADSFG